MSSLGAVWLYATPKELCLVQLFARWGLMAVARKCLDSPLPNQHELAARATWSFSNPQTLVKFCIVKFFIFIFVEWDVAVGQGERGSGVLIWQHSWDKCESYVCLCYVIAKCAACVPREYGWSFVVGPSSASYVSLCTSPTRLSTMWWCPG